MTYLLDTNVVIAVLRNKPTIVRERFRGVVTAGGLIVVSSVVLFELWYGVARSARREENTERLRVFLSGVSSVLPFGEGDAQMKEVLQFLKSKSAAITVYIDSDYPGTGKSTDEIVKCVSYVRGAMA